MKHLLTFATLFCTLSHVQAQDALSSTFAIRSLSADTDSLQPIIHADNTVTFRFKAPTAKKVLIDGSFLPTKVAFHRKNITLVKQKPVRMQRMGDYWEYTTDTLTSEMYTYRFLVDKKYVLDPHNLQRTVRDISDTLNYFFIQGKLACYYQEQDIPHGTLQKVWYPCTLNGMSQRRMFIYTPAGYSASSQVRYPVLYLLHGSGGDETSWSDYGRVCQILDGMIARHECRPMVVVMPNGNVLLDAAPGQSPYMNKQPFANNISSMFGNYEKLFQSEIVSYIEQNYHVYTDKAHRAIAGLSLGGLHTIYIAANNPQSYDYIGLFSPQTTNMLDDKTARQLVNRARNTMQDVRNIVSIIIGKLPQITDLNEKFRDISIYDSLQTKLARQFNPAPRLYYIAVGNNDFVLPLVDKFRMKLDEAGYPYIYNPTDGSHTWENWRKYLIDFLPRLFPDL